MTIFPAGNTIPQTKSLDGGVGDTFEKVSPKKLHLIGKKRPTIFYIKDL